MKKKRIGILIVAYNTEHFIEQVLDRIPQKIKDKVEEIAIFDDHSHDNTVEKGKKYKEKNKMTNLYIYSNKENIGYGGNQKKGYSYFIEKGYDIVILLHGDGQYAPELLPVLLEPLEKGECDAVFGSRMLSNPLNGGMPLYKYVGNKVLTILENFSLNMNMSEFHSGYRLYSCHALKKIPFMYNTNDFHFDTEIIIQFKQNNLEIIELPIPTYYGDEISNLKIFSYGLNVLKSVFFYKLHCWGLRSDKKYTIINPEKA